MRLSGFRRADPLKQSFDDATTIAKSAACYDRVERHLLHPPPCLDPLFCRRRRSDCCSLSFGDLLSLSASCGWPSGCHGSVFGGSLAAESAMLAYLQLAERFIFRRFQEIDLAAASPWVGRPRSCFGW